MDRTVRLGLKARGRHRCSLCQKSFPASPPLWDGAQGAKPGPEAAAQLQIKIGRLCNRKCAAPSTPSHQLKNWGFAKHKRRRLCWIEKNSVLFKHEEPTFKISPSPARRTAFSYDEVLEPNFSACWGQKHVFNTVPSDPSFAPSEHWAQNTIFIISSGTHITF